MTKLKSILKFKASLPLMIKLKTKLEINSVFKELC